MDILSKCKKLFTDNQYLPHMTTVMTHHYVSLNELFPLFRLDTSKKMCLDEFYHCQMDIPLLSMEEMSSIESKDGKLIIHCDFNSSKARFLIDDFLVLKHINFIIRDMFQDEEDLLNLKTTFEEKDDDGITKTQWEIINSFYSDINRRLYRLIKNDKFKEDLKNAYQKFYISRTKEITSQLNIEFDQIIVNVK